MNGLSKALVFCYKVQNTYKEPLDIKDRVLAWKFVLEDEFSVEQILGGLRHHLKTSKNMPVPADIYKLLKPEKPKITQTEFIDAKEQYRLSGFNQFTKAYAVVKAFKEQEKAAREELSVDEILERRNAIGVHPNLQKLIGEKK